MSSTSEAVDKAIKYIQGKEVKGKLEELIKTYNGGKDDVNTLLECKDGFNQLNFFLGSLFGRTKDLVGKAELEAQEAFNAEYLHQRSEVGENGKLQSVDDCKYKTRLLVSESTLVHLQADVAVTYLRGYLNTCKNYTDSCIQRISVLKDEKFYSRQQV